MSTTAEKKERDEVATLCHGLRTPLAVILQAAERVEDPSLRALLERNVARMTELLDQATKDLDAA